MTDTPSAYHRKLADSLWKRCWLMAGEADKTFIDKHDFAAALAAEGVVTRRTMSNCNCWQTTVDLS